VCAALGLHDSIDFGRTQSSSLGPANGWTDQTAIEPSSAHTLTPSAFKRSVDKNLVAWWPNATLFLLTFATTTAFGGALTEAFNHNQPLTLDTVLYGYKLLVTFDAHLWAGLKFSIPLLVILLSHEFGHYFECRRRNVDASLPYFLPSPSLFGTFGAFIRIKSPIYSRQGLFDIGIGGPLAGFITLLPMLIIGMALSKPVAHPFTGDFITFGTPLAFTIVAKLFYPGVPSSQLLLHPFLVAAWAGLFATALNLLPIGQLDGGHICYAIGGEQWHRRASLAFVGVLICAGFYYWPWWLWAVASFFFYRRHPLVYDNTQLSRSRIVLCFGALFIFVFSATVVPVK
jgi:membrane-associated protease RseP (regulator of RpoE activity)